MSCADFSKRLAPAARSRLQARIEAVLAGRGRKARLATDYAYFAPECLKIRAKAGSITPFCFNRAQLFIHARLEEQRAATGRVRALILKGRQQGCSTYVGGRFYHRAIHGRGLRVFILTHEDPATQNLFDMVDRFHAHCPAEIRPVTGHANAKELSFDTLDSEEPEYRRLYGLDLAQMAWRRARIGELRDPALFKQEYPATAAEAFQMSGHDSFIPPALVARARKAVCAPSGPLVIGFDPAWKGGDRHALARRRGRQVIDVESRVGLDTMQSAGWMKQVIEREKPRRVFVDVGGVGAGVYDRLCEMGFGEIVRPVNFGSSPMEPPPLDAHGQPSGGPGNRRAEMWMKSKAWLEDPAGAQIPDRDSLQADARGPSYSYDSHPRLILESKDKMRQRGVPSPDEWDAVALTFAEPVASDAGFSRKLAYPEAGVV